MNINNKNRNIQISNDDTTTQIQITISWRNVLALLIAIGLVIYLLILK